VLIVPFAIGVEMNRIVPIIIIATAMGFLKGYNFYCNNEILQNDKIFQEGLL
jgi:hypothetical protein